MGILRAGTTKDIHVGEMASSDEKSLKLNAEI